MTDHPLSYRLYLFDCDGTLRTCRREGQPCPNAPDEWDLLPNVHATLAHYDWGVLHRWAFITNQAGVALGFLDDAMNRRLLLDLERACGLPSGIRGVGQWRVCTHHPRHGCVCRKPSPYMLLQAIQEADIPVMQTLYVGDMDSDREAAQRAGVAYMPAAEFFNWS